MMPVVPESLIWILAEPNLDYRNVEWGMDEVTFHPLSKLIDKVFDPSPVNSFQVVAAFLLVRPPLRISSQSLVF